MYLPAEAVYYELVCDRLGGTTSPLAYALERNVIPVSPSTLHAYLLVLVLGFKGLQIEEHAREVMTYVAGLGRDFDRFKADFDVVGKHLGQRADEVRRGREAALPLRDEARAGGRVRAGHGRRAPAGDRRARRVGRRAAARPRRRLALEPQERADALDRAEVGAGDDPGQAAAAERLDDRRVGAAVDLRGLRPVDRALPGLRRRAARTRGSARRSAWTPLGKEQRLGPGVGHGFERRLPPADAAALRRGLSPTLQQLGLSRRTTLRRARARLPRATPGRACAPRPGPIPPAPPAPDGVR